MDLQPLLTLKENLITAEDFREPWNYFFEHFGESEEFLRLGEVVKDVLLKKLLIKIGEELFQGNIEITHLVLKEIPEYHFLHGACFIQERMASVIFFKDIDMGLVAVSTSLFSYNVLLIRFSSIYMESDQPVFFSPSRTKAIQ